MRSDRFNIFTNRQEIFALFQLLYERNTKEAEKPLPILLLQAPGGGGVSMLMDLLAERSTAGLPHAYLDFAQSGTPVVIQEILQNICDQIQLSEDRSVRKLTFPRCQLGLSTILEPMTESTTSEVRKAIERRIAKSLPLHEQLDDLINATSNLLFPVALLFVLFKWLLKILEKSPPLRDLLWSSTMKWYKRSSHSLRLPPSSDIIDILIILRQWSRPNETKQHQLIVERLLLDAFLEDLREAFDQNRTRSARERTTNVVLFLDNFDVLQAGGGGNELLDMLIKNRLEGKSDPLLVVIGSHQRHFDYEDPAQNMPFEQPEGTTTWQDSNEYAHILYAQWKTRLQEDRRQLELHLCLPIWLHDFGLNETASYLWRVMGQGQLTAFEYRMLIEEIQRITYGHPLALKLVTEVLQEARIRGRTVGLHEVMSEIVPSNTLTITNYEQKTVGEFLLSVLLRQLPETEQEQLAYCSAPRMLDISLLKMIVGLNSEKEAKDLWMRYSKFTFVRSSEQKTMLLHPLARDLLTQLLISLSTPGKDYYKVVHSNLREHFGEIANADNDLMSVKGARIEEAYHALCLGDPEAAIVFLCSAISNKDDTWRDAMASIVQAPTVYMSQNIVQRATKALFQARINRRLEDIVAVLVLYSWLLKRPGLTTSERADLWYILSETYRYLPDQKNYQEYQKLASDYFEKAQVLITEKALVEIYPDSRTPLIPFPVRKINKRWRTFRLIAVGLLMTILFTSYLSLYYGQYSRTSCNPYGVLSPTNVIHSAYFSQVTRVTHAPDGECIGISDGTFAFDVNTNLAAGAYKTQAANYLMQGDKGNAGIYWEKAHEEDPSDAETLIYEENQNVMRLVETQGYTYITVVVVTMLTSSPQHQKTAPGRDDLRGAYIAQLQQNSNFKTPLLRLLIANAGDSSMYAVPLANQIIQAQKEDKTIVGVIGPPQSRDETIVATKMLGEAHIPVVSAATSSDAFTNISPYFFRASANNSDQVNLGVKYAESRLGAKTAVLFEDPHDNYSKSLSDDFIKRFQAQDHHILLKTELYDAKDTENVSNKLAEEINNACTYNPDLIYFSGRTDEMIVLLNNLPSCGKDHMTKILAADELDQVISEPGGRFPSSASNRLYYTSFASAYEWNQAQQKIWYPTQFFESYRATFDANNKVPNQNTVPDGHMILAYDAASIFLYAIISTVKNTKMVHFNLEDLRKSIAAISGNNAFQGVSGVINFGPKPTGDPINKAIVVLGVDEQGKVKLEQTFGQLQKVPDPTNPSRGI